MPARAVPPTSSAYRPLAGPPTATPAGLPGEDRPSHLHITLEHPKGSLPRVGGPQQLTDFRPLGADAENCSWTGRLEKPHCGEADAKGHEKGKMLRVRLEISCQGKKN